jgi:hypothetical protein
LASQKKNSSCAVRLLSRPYADEINTSLLVVLVRLHGSGSARLFRLKKEDDEICKRSVGTHWEYHSLCWLQ